MSFSSPVSNIFISIALIALPGEGPVRYVDLEGRSQTPLAFEKKKAAVLLFLMPDCPVSNAYGPEIQRICKSYEAKSIALPGEGPVRYVDLEGRSQTPLAFEKKKAAVLLFL